MRLSDILGAEVRDSRDHCAGTVIDIRLALDRDLKVRSSAPRLVGLVISPRTRSSYLGYERTDARSPLLLAAVARWLHRGTFLARWDDVARIGPDTVALRDGYTRYSPLLRGDD